MIGPRSAILLHGHVLDKLTELPESSVHCIVTSPPYWGLRDYKIPPQVWGGDPACRHEWSIENIPVQRGTGGNWTQAENGEGLRTGVSQTRFRGDARAARGTAEMATAERGSCSRCGAWLGSLGLEPTVQLYVSHLVQVFRAVRRVLRDDGALWLNLGDTYISDAGASVRGSHCGKNTAAGELRQPNRKASREMGLKPKDLAGIPWRVALALQDDGWYLRSEIIWSKLAPMPESVRDRPTRAHEHVFLLAKSERYFYDADAARELDKGTDHRRAVLDKPEPSGNILPAHMGIRVAGGRNGYGRNTRTVWELGPEPCAAPHFATFPSGIPRRAILAGTSAGGCCAACGAPRVRVTQRRFVPQDDVSAKRRRREKLDESSRWGGTERGYTNVQTSGWRSVCDCGVGVVPCVVLDPFAGSGRTLTTALQLGRSAAGIELSEVYLEDILRPAVAAALAAPVQEELPLSIERDGGGAEQSPLFAP